jgi:recombination protein RecA
MEEKEVCIK